MDEATKAEVRGIAFSCIDTFKKNFKEDICNPHQKKTEDIEKEVKGMRESLNEMNTCIAKKFSKLYILMIGALVALVLNVILKAF